METQYTIPLGDYNMSNTIVSLNLTINMIDHVKNYHNPGVYMAITLPYNYPPTTLSNHFNPSAAANASLLKNEPKTIFYAIMTVSAKDTPTFDWFVNTVSNDYYEEDIDHVVLLREFYIAAREHHIPLIKEEEVYTRGLGKRCLCLAMPYVIDYFNMDSATTSIGLTANGGLQLFNYYTKAYGFSPLYNTRTSESMFMVTDLDTFMEHCHHG